MEPEVLKTIENVLNWGNLEDPENSQPKGEIIEGIFLALRSQNIKSVHQYIISCIRIIPDLELAQLKRHSVLLEACFLKLAQLEKWDINLVKETLEYVSHSLPNNQYNMSEALESLAFNIEWDNIQTACSIFLSDILPTNNTTELLYNKNDLDKIRADAYQEGYQAGQNHCQNIDSDLDDRFSNLQLTK